jgi:cyanophycin synthetase
VALKNLVFFNRSKGLQMVMFEKDEHASYKLLERALIKKGYVMEFDETPPATATYVSPSNKRWATRAARIAYPFTSEAARKLSIDKAKSYDFAVKQGFSIPYTRDAEGISSEDARRLFRAYGKLVVKPTDSSQARGVTLNITSQDQLVRAITHAKTISSRVLVQQQVSGEELRLTVIEGKVENILLRQPARIIGDGVLAINELVRVENKQRQSLHFEHITYPQLTAELIDARLLSSQRVPGRGEVVALSDSALINRGASVQNVTNTVNPSYIRAIENLVADLGAGLIVVDIFCIDYTLPMTKSNCWLIEFNTAPALKMYYGCRDGKQYDICRRLATMVNIQLSEYHV